MQLMHFSFFKEKKINLVNNKDFWVVAFSLDLKRFKNQVNISATFMKPFIKANCAIFK